MGIECYIGGTRLIYSIPAYGVIAIAALLSVASLRRKGSSPPNAFCLGSTLLLGAWVLVRARYSPVEYLAWPDYFMMIGCLMTYLLTAYYLSGAREQTVLIVVLWAIAALEVWVALVQFGKDPNFMLLGFLRSKTERPSGMYISPNNFAGFLAAVAIISLSLGIWSRWRVWVKIVACYIAVTCWLGVAISGSRGGYFDSIGSLLAFAAATVYTIRIAEPRKFLPAAFACLGGLAAMLGLAVFLMFHSDLLTHRMQGMVAKDVRIYNWAAAIDHIRFSPWIGTGSGTHLIYGRLFRRPEIQADPVHAHCDYLELLAEYGAVGGVCMALFLIAHVRNACRSLSDILRRRLIPSGLHRSNSFAIQLGALCAVAGLAIHSIFDFDMHIPGNALIFAFLFGVLANPGMERRTHLADRCFAPLGKVVLPALGILMLWRGMPLIPSEYFAEMARISLRNRAFLDSIAYAQKAIGPNAAPDPASPAGQPQQHPLLFDRLIARTGGDPKDPDLYFYMGEANRVLGVRMLNSYMRKQYYSRAAAAFSAGLRVFPQDESMLIRYGQVLDGLHRYADAEGIYQTALSWDPNLGTVHEYYENHLKAEGKTAEAAESVKARQSYKPVVVDSGAAADDYRLQ